MALQLPEHPNLEQLKRQAKELLAAIHSGDAAARTRLAILPAPAPGAIALHDAQSVIAREYGFASWNALRQRVEQQAGDAEAMAAFIEAATDGRGDRAELLLVQHPAIAHSGLTAALLLGDAAEVERHLAAQPALAIAPGGPRQWQPLHYVCYTSVGTRSPEREAGLVAIARRLLARGADANLKFPWVHHNVSRPVLWGAVCVTQSLSLATVLLEAGADPSDGITLVLAASSGNVSALDLLLAHGADINRPWATDGAAPLYAILQWSRNSVGAHWLLAHGAQPDPIFDANGETPLHTAAAAWDVPLAEALVARGADPLRPRADGRTPYALAELNGNRAVADWLRSRGAASALSPLDQLIAACSRHDRAALERLLETEPNLRHQLGPEQYAIFYRAAERNDVTALELMLEAGFDPNQRDDREMGRTALHAAAMAGWPEAVRVLVAHGASLSTRDREFKAQPLFWAAEGSRRPAPGSDHAAVGRLLIQAGSPLSWQPHEEPSAALLAIVEGWRQPLAS